MNLLHPTRVRDLVAPLVIFGAVVYLMLRRTDYGSLPVHYLTALPIAVLAIAEFLMARRVRAAVRHDPRAKPIAAITIARWVVLGKASALVGSAVVGACLALLGRVLPHASRVTAAAAESRVGGVLLLASVALVAAGLYLERAGVTPSDKSGHPA